MTGFANLVVLDLECADPPALAEFYHQVLGWDIMLSEPEYTEISHGTTRILFTRREGYEGPGWPESTAKRYHLCMQTDDVATAVQRCLELGARQPEFQPGGERWTVLTDPSGHPFCLAKAEPPRAGNATAQASMTSVAPGMPTGGREVQAIPRSACMAIARE